MEYILITGGLGFIGSHIVVLLLQNNYDIIVIDNLSNSNKNVINDIKKIIDKDFIFYDYDLMNINEIDRIFDIYKISSVIHLASLKSVNESIKNPLSYYNNNVTGFLNLLNTMKKYDCKKIIFSSSATVYGLIKYPVDEGTITGNKISNPYGKTKYFIEEILFDLYNSDKSFSITILRYFNPIGAHESGFIGENPKDMPNNIFPYLLKVSSGEYDKLNIFGSDYDTKDGTCIRDFIHVMDLAESHIIVLNLFKVGLNIYNVGTGKGYSVLDLITTFEKVNNIKIKYEFAEKRKGDIDIVYANVDKIYKELKWKAKYSLEDMCRHGYNFINKN